MKTENSSKRAHGLDLTGEGGKTYPSNATAIRLLGIALEELERNLLWKMGGHVGGIQEVAEMAIHTNSGCVGIQVFLNFDAHALRDYVDGPSKRSGFLL
jgi:hypothetical protein